MFKFREFKDLFKITCALTLLYFIVVVSVYATVFTYARKHTENLDTNIQNLGNYISSNTVSFKYISTTVPDSTIELNKNIYDFLSSSNVYSPSTELYKSASQLFTLNIYKHIIKNVGINGDPTTITNAVNTFSSTSKLTYNTYYSDFFPYNTQIISDYTNKYIGIMRKNNNLTKVTISEDTWTQLASEVSNRTRKANQLVLKISPDNAKSALFIASIAFFVTPIGALILDAILSKRLLTLIPWIQDQFNSIQNRFSGTHQQ
jgi:acetyltransferase-like isoleucine patch superfamily enzyme